MTEEKKKTVTADLLKLPLLIGVQGMILATAISWSLYQSVIWAFIQGMCGWFYVLYFAIRSGRLF